MKITSEMKAEINKLYDNGGTAGDIAIQFNISKISVNTCLLNPRKQGNKTKITEEMVKQFKNLYYDQEKSTCFIAKQFDISHTTVAKYLDMGWK